MNVRQRVEEILQQGYLMSLGTVDMHGVWVSDVIFVYDADFTIYWKSDPKTRHSKAIMKNRKVAATISIRNKSGKDNSGIQIVGYARKIEGDRYDIAVKHVAKRGHAKPKETDDVLQGDSWYVLKPTRIQLIDKKYFGYDKWVLDLTK